MREQLKDIAWIERQGTGRGVLCALGGDALFCFVSLLFCLVLSCHVLPVCLPSSYQGKRFMVVGWSGR